MKRIRSVFALTVLLLTLTCCAKPTPQEGAGEAQTGQQAFTEEQTVKPDDRTGESKPVFACDAAFFGDSITADSNFDTFFEDRTIVNLGVYGDTINDLRRRVQTLRETNPARIFLLVGINCLREDNLPQCVEDYSALIGDIRSACPEAALHIQSVLPIGAEVEAPGWCTNETVRAFNAELEKLARSRGLPYIDLYSLYEKDGVLDPAKTRDGLHLNFNCYGPWAEAVHPYLTGNTP